MEDRNEIERLILIINIGLMTAMEKGILKTEEIENFLYSPYSMEKLKKLGVDKNVITLINLGCELENVERLIPDKLSSSVDEIMTLSVEKLKMLPKPEMPTKKWID